jgi:hypothetical protein
MEASKPLTPDEAGTLHGGPNHTRIPPARSNQNRAGTCGYTWRVPDDLKINGSEEEFTATVTYDTQKLYGKVSAARKITIRK